MDDGSKIKEGLHLNSYAFSSKEINLLLDTLNSKFKLNCSIHKKGDTYSMRVNYESMDLLRSLVISHMHKSMFYKININN
jgi:hypothetical protein